MYLSKFVIFWIASGFALAMTQLSVVGARFRPRAVSADRQAVYFDRLNLWFSSFKFQIPNFRFSVRSILNLKFET
jgi:hypothetical protein